MIMFHDYDDCFDGCEPKFLVRLDDDAIGVKNDNRPDCPYFVFKTKKETAVKYRIPPLFVTLIAAATLASSGAAQAALNDRGGGLLYDDVLNVTWLQDANYAKTSGYDADGRMNWTAATATPTRATTPTGWTRKRSGWNWSRRRRTPAPRP